MTGTPRLEFAAGRPLQDPVVQRGDVSRHLDTQRQELMPEALEKPPIKYLAESPGISRRSTLCFLIASQSRS
jgi:hypothetical protein